MSVRSRCLYSNEQTAKGQIRVVVVVVVVGLVSLVHSLAACWANILQAGNVTPYTISSSRLIDTLQDNAHLVHAFAAFLHGISTMAIARFASPHYAPRFLLIRCSLVSGGGMPPPPSPLPPLPIYPFVVTRSLELISTHRIVARCRCCRIREIGEYANDSGRNLETKCHSFFFLKQQLRRVTVL